MSLSRKFIDFKTIIKGTQMIRWIFLFFLPFSAHAISQKKAENAVIKGNQAMAQKQWEQAIHYYQKALTFADSAQIYFNLANAYASQQQPGYALFYYLKAKHIQPRWNKLQAFEKNLYATYPNLPQFNTIWHQQIFNYFTWKTWRNTGFIFFWISVFLGIIYVGFKRSHVLLKGCIYSGIFCSLIAILLALNYKYQNLYIAVEETIVRFAPTETSPTRHIWPLGTYCWPKDQREDYLFVSNDRAEDGWVNKSHLRALAH